MIQKCVHVRIDPKVYTQVTNYCFDNGIKIKSFIEMALIEKLDKVGRYEFTSKTSKRSK